jgi:hypothetical protein
MERKKNRAPPLVKVMPGFPVTGCAIRAVLSPESHRTFDGCCSARRRVQA